MGGYHYVLVSHALAQGLDKVRGICGTVGDDANQLRVSAVEDIIQEDLESVVFAGSVGCFQLLYLVQSL